MNTTRITLPLIALASLVGCYGGTDDDPTAAPSAARLSATQRCATPVPSSTEVNSMYMALNAALPVSGATIEVHVHVIARGPTAADGVVPPEQIQNQINVLNAAFAPTGFSFVLVSTDTTVNSTWYTAGPGTTAQTQMKHALRRGGAESLNLYISHFDPVGNTNDYYSWATFPSSYSGNPMDDGVVLNNQTLPGAPVGPYNLGDTGTHEVGHWLGLLHTFQGGCSQQASSGGDLVSDTPAEKTPHYGCSASRDTCTSIAGLDPITNFMDYSDDSCMSQFTPGQGDNMRRAYAAWRLRR